MPGLLVFHAHPDDEVVGTGGTLAHYAGAGEQTVVVTATDGAEGEIHNYDDPASLKHRLAEIRAEEMMTALAVLGVKDHEFLGYRDSGMMGSQANTHPRSFWQADFMEATTRLVGILRRHRPEVMVVYDPFGGYGHPDHIQAHRVGMAAFFGATDLARFPLADGEVPFRPAKLYWTVWPRSVARRYADLRKAAGTIDDVEYRSLQEAGTPDEDVNAWMEVSHLVDLIYQALKAHRSQFPLDGFLLGMPEEMRTELLGREAFIRVWSEVEVPRRETDLFSGLR